MSRPDLAAIEARCDANDINALVAYARELEPHAAIGEAVYEAARAGCHAEGLETDILAHIEALEDAKCLGDDVVAYVCSILWALRDALPKEANDDTTKS